MKYNIKYAMKRGEKLNDIKKKYFNKFSENSHKKFISS
jgi:hypothetical protein